MSNQNTYPKNAPFDNVAELTTHTDHTDCECCYSPILFAMRDNYHDFMLDLPTVLKCLEIAEQQGEVPALGNEFWTAIKNRYQID